MATVREKKDERIELRVTPSHKRMLQEAADTAHTDVSQFVLQTSLVEAENILASRTRFVLQADQWNQLMEMLDAPPTPASPALQRLMKEPSALER